MNVPTLKGIQDEIINSFESYYGTISRQTQSTFSVISQVFASQIRLLYQGGAFVQRNVFPDLADTEAMGGTLERFGRAKLGREPFPATQGEYEINVTGSIGGTITAGTTFTYNEYSYYLDTSFTFTDVVGLITVRALQPGTDSTLAIGDEITATIPILNVDQSGTVATVIEPPQESEDIEDYRELILQAFRTESQGGASGDYRIWAADAQGVRLVYPFLSAPGSISLFIEATIESSTDGKGTPTAAIIEDVEEVVTMDPDDTKNVYDRGRLPLDVYDITYTAVTQTPVTVTVTGYTGSTVDDYDTIQSAIKQFLYDIRPYISGADLEDLSRLSISKLITAISNAAPADFSSVTMTVNGGAETLFVFDNGNIPDLTQLTINA